MHEQRPNIVNSKEYAGVRKDYHADTDRNLQQYCRAFGLKIRDLAGKKILDVGSGHHEAFSKQAKKYGAEVFSLNPSLRYEVYRDYLTKSKGWLKKSIAGEAENLPVRNELFDLITAYFSVPYQLERPNQSRQIKQMEASIVVKNMAEALNLEAN